MATAKTTASKAAPKSKKKATSDKAKVEQPKIVWDDSNMKSLYANVSNVTGGREEIVLLFGMNQAWHSNQQEIKVDLAERIVLNPHAAKRLAMLLGRTVSEYEKRFGTLDLTSGDASIDD